MPLGATSTAVTESPTSGIASLLGGLGGSSSTLGNVLSLGGAGLGAYSNQQSYNTLQNALNAIGPTALQGYNMSGPGGMSTGYNQNGQGSINLGALNSGYGGFANAAGGSNLYSPQLLAQLTGNASGTLGAATNTLGSAYNNYGLGMNAANTQLGALNQTYGQVYGNTLSSLQAQQQPQVQQQAFGLQNTLFGNGVLGTTGAGSGAIAAGNFGSQVNAMNAQDQLAAQQAALSAQSAGVQNYAGLSGAASNILGNAFNTFGNTNQLISGMNTAQLNNAATAGQGAGVLNTIGLNNYQAALQTGAAQAQARNGSLFPYAQVATALAGQPNALTSLSSMLSSAGSSLGGQGGLSSLFGGNNNTSGLLGNLFGGGGSGVLGAGSEGTALATDPALLYSGDLGSLAGTASGAETAGVNSLANSGTWDLGSMMGFNTAGGGAAAGAGASDAAVTGGLSNISDADLAGLIGSDAGAGSGAGAGAAAGAGGAGAGAGLASLAAGAGIFAGAAYGMEALADHDTYNQEDAIGNANNFASGSQQNLQAQIANGNAAAPPGSVANMQYQAALMDQQMAQNQLQAVSSPTWGTQQIAASPWGGLGFSGSGRRYSQS